MRNRRHVQGIIDDDGGGKDMGTTAETASLQWRAWGIGNNYGGVGRERWPLGLDNDDGGGVSRRYNAPERTSSMMEAEVCLRVHVIDDNNNGIGRGRQDQGLRDDDRGVDGRQQIGDASKGSETTTEAAGDRRWSWWIYEDNEAIRSGVGGGRLAWGLRNDNRGVVRGQQIDDASNGLEKTTETAGYQQLAQGIYDDDGGVGRGRRAQILQQRQRRYRRRIDK